MFCSRNHVYWFDDSAKCTRDRPHMAAKISSYGVYVLLVGIILTVFTAGRNNRNVIERFWRISQSSKTSLVF